MNYSAVIYILGWILNFEGFFLLFPCIVAIIYREKTGVVFAGCMLLCLLLGAMAIHIGRKDKEFYAKEGLVTVSIGWVILSVFGALPFFLSGEIPFFEDALFETISGFTTTGASILSDVEALSKCSLFWRSFTHWVGGMGVLVFVLAVLPLAGGYNMHLMRAESPGPQVGKLVPKVRSTAMILYGIYVFLTALEVLLLLFGGMPLFDALTLSFGTAGTGGFSIKNDGLAGYTSYQQTIITVFMIICATNFNVYYFILMKKAKQILKLEEVMIFLGIILFSALFITWDIRHLFSNLREAGHHALFQVASILSTTGYSTTDFNVWPETAKTILILLMFTGGCASSTSGGIKVSRMVICMKMLRKELSTFTHPKSVKSVHMEGRAIGQEVQFSVAVFVMTFAMLFIISLFILTFNEFDFTTNFTAVATTLGNVGPGFAKVGPMDNFGKFSVLSKVVLMFNMLAGRLELFPILVLFYPKTWRK